MRKEKKIMNRTTKKIFCKLKYTFFFYKELRYKVSQLDKETKNMRKAEENQAVMNIQKLYP